MGYKAKTHVFIWAGAIFLIIVTSIYFFMDEYKYLTFTEALYSTLRLFVFERDIDPFPQSWPLIVIYFVAPLVAISAVGKIAIMYLFRVSPSLKTRWLSDHVLVCGVGRTGKLIAETLKKNGVNVVGIDKGPPENFDLWREKHKILMVFGNFHLWSVHEKAGARKARSIIFSSGDDLANLEGAMGAYEWMENGHDTRRTVWTHIANERLSETASLIVRANGHFDLRFFDTYHIAAEKMIEQHFSPDMREGISEVNILGFGKFGRDLMEVLVMSMAPGESFQINVIDLAKRGAVVNKLARDLGVSELVDFMRMDIYGLDLVDEVDKAFFLCTDDDLGNLTLAMMLASKADANHIYVRMAKWPIPAIADQLGEDQGVVFVNINELAIQGVEGLPGLIQPAT